MKTPIIQAPYRLLMNVLALAVMLVVLVYSPAPTTVKADGCENGCIWWTQACGCQQYAYCCVTSDPPTYWCSYSVPYLCTN